MVSVTWNTNTELHIGPIKGPLATAADVSLLLLRCRNHQGGGRGVGRGGSYAPSTPSPVDAAATPQLNSRCAEFPESSPLSFLSLTILIPHSKLLQSCSHSRYNSAVVLGLLLCFSSLCRIYDRSSGDCEIEIKRKALEEMLVWVDVLIIERATGSGPLDGFWLSVAPPLKWSEPGPHFGSLVCFLCPRD